MTDDLRSVPTEFFASEAVDDRPAQGLRIVSWNLLRLVGAGVEDVARLIRQHQPDLLVMQEATKELAELPALVGGHFYREPLHGRVYGLAVWSPQPFPRPKVLPLPVSTMPGRVPPRLAQIIRFGGATFANVHLSHGQFLNRWQLLHIARSLDGPAAIIGDYNAVGPIKLPGFKDLGPRQPTHSPTNVISFRLDRCMAHGLQCVTAQVLQRGPSDHHPIFLELRTNTDEETRKAANAHSFIQRRTEHLIGKVSRLSTRSERRRA